jgi:hypothetical protein
MGKAGMTDIPLNKALVPVSIEDKSNLGCDNCYLVNQGFEDQSCYFLCSAENRKDGNDVIFKLADYPGNSA